MGGRGGLVVLQSNVCFATMGSIPVGGSHCPSYQRPYRLAKYPEGDRGVLSQRGVSFIGEVVTGSDVKLRGASASSINWRLGGHLWCDKAGYPGSAIHGSEFFWISTLRGNATIKRMRGAGTAQQCVFKTANTGGGRLNFGDTPPERVGVPLLKLLTGMPRVILCSSRRGLETLVLFSGLKSHTTGKLPDVRCLPPIIRVRT